jgi:hypothetical protein
MSRETDKKGIWREHCEALNEDIIFVRDYHECLSLKNKR